MCIDLDEFIYYRDKLSTDSRRLLGIHATIPTKTAFAHRFSRLRGRVRRFQEEALDIYGVEDVDDLHLRLPGEDLTQTNTDLDEEGWGELIDVELPSDEQESLEREGNDSDNEGEDDVVSLQTRGSPDKDTLLMPSSLSPFVVQRLKLEHLTDLELKLRIGQLNDSLDGLMLALCTQGLLLRTKVRNASGTKTKTRAFNEVTKVRREVEFHVRSYRRARKALLALSVDVELINRYPPINKEDLKTADFTDERRLGQSTDTLAWFWKIGAGEADKNELKEECEFHILTIAQD